MEYRESYSLPSTDVSSIQQIIMRWVSSTLTRLLGIGISAVSGCSRIIIINYYQIKAELGCGKPPFYLLTY